MPPGLEGGPTPVPWTTMPGSARKTWPPPGDWAAPGRRSVADRDGNLYVTFSGSREQQAPISIFVVRPDGTAGSFAGVVPNFVDGVRSRGHAASSSDDSEGTVYRVTPDGSASILAAVSACRAALRSVRPGALRG